MPAGPLKKSAAGQRGGSFAQQGITTICERVEFVDPHTVESQQDAKRVTRPSSLFSAPGRCRAFRRSQGLEEAGYVTNRNVFDWTTLPQRIVVLGGGAIGCELGQVFRRFGAEVTILHNGARILARDDADAAHGLAGAA